MGDNSERRTWRHRFGEFELGGRTLIMGVLNVTPDSFSDGGQYIEVIRAVERAKQIEAEGAHLIDIGAESTRPGSESVPSADQIDRLVPVLRALRKTLRIPISIDTQCSQVAEAALAEGAAVVNDVSGLMRDPAIAVVCKHYGAGLILMHMRGMPASMQLHTVYHDLIQDIRESLRKSVATSLSEGLESESLLVDPGLGFGKTFGQNHCIIAALNQFHGLGAGVLVGPSRKGFTAELSGHEAKDRVFATAAAVTLCILNGADAIRVHDVSPMVEVAQFVDRHKKTC